MFYGAEALLLGEGLTFSKHSGVIAAFGRHFAATGRVPTELHRYLIDSQDDRIKGDYDIDAVTTSEAVRVHVAHAEAFLDIATELIGTPSEANG